MTRKQTQQPTESSWSLGMDMEKTGFLPKVKWRSNRDLLLHLHPRRFLRLPFRKPRGCRTLAGDEWADTIHNKKGEMVMTPHAAVWFAHGLILGGILVGFAWIVLKK